MPDMLVKLYELPPIPIAEIETLERRGISVRRALAPEKHIVTQWVRDTFGQGWANELEIAFSRLPISAFIAVEDNRPIGFACYEVTFRGFFGPTGVAESHRGLGLGKILLLKALHALYDQGYAYGIIGGVGPAKFYQRAVGATLIDDSAPGMYGGLLKDQ